MSSVRNAPNRAEFRSLLKLHFVALIIHIQFIRWWGICFRGVSSISQSGIKQSRRTEACRLSSSRICRFSEKYIKPCVKLNPIFKKRTKIMLDNFHRYVKLKNFQELSCSIALYSTKYFSIFWRYCHTHSNAFVFFFFHKNIENIVRNKVVWTMKDSLEILQLCMKIYQISIYQIKFSCCFTYFVDVYKSGISLYPRLSSPALYRVYISTL